MKGLVGENYRVGSSNICVAVNIVFKGFKRLLFVSGVLVLSLCVEDFETAVCSSCFCFVLFSFRKLRCRPRFLLASVSAAHSSHVKSLLTRAWTATGCVTTSGSQVGCRVVSTLECCLHICFCLSM